VSAAPELADEELTKSSGGTAPEKSGPHRFTSESGRRAQALRGTKSPTGAQDEDIEKALRKRAQSGDPKAAEVLLRWLARPRDVAPEQGLDELTDTELSVAYAGLLRLARLTDEELAHALASLAPA